MPRFATACALDDPALPLNLQSIREDGRSELIEILEMHPGTKLLILDSSLGNLLSHVLTDSSKVFEVGPPRALEFQCLVPELNVVSLRCMCASSGWFIGERGNPNHRAWHGHVPRSQRGCSHGLYACFVLRAAVSGALPATRSATSRPAAT